MTTLHNESIKFDQNNPVEIGDKQREDFLQTLLNGYLILGAVLFFAQVYLTLQSDTWWMLFIALFLFVFQLFITFNFKLKTEVRSGAFSILLLMVGAFSMVNFGLNALGFVYFLLSVVIAAHFHSRNVWITSISITAILIVILTSLTGAGILPLGESYINPSSLFFIISEISIFLFMVIAFVIPLFTFVNSVRSLVDLDRSSLDVFRNENQGLSESIDQINQARSQQTDLLEKVRKLVDQIYLFKNSKSFLPQSIEIINAAFDFGYCGVFISDEKREFAVFMAGTGDAGKAMLQRNHKLRIREEGMVGYVTARGEFRVSNDVLTDPYHKFNPLLPESKAELVLPLKIAGETIGALDFQSNQINAFQDHVIEALQLLADQFSLIYIKNNEVAYLERKIQDLESSSTRAVREYWQSRIKGSRKSLGFAFRDNEITNWEATSEEEIDALQSNNYTVLASKDVEKNVSTLLVPISIQNQPIGLISVRYSGMMFPEELELLTRSLSERLSSSIETAQLYEEIDEKTERETVLNTISTKVRNARDIDSILRSTATELGKAMGVDEVRVHIKTGE